MTDVRRDRIRHALQRGAEEEGVELTEADEHMAVAFLDSIIPADAEVLSEDEIDEMFGHPEETEEKG